MAACWGFVGLVVLILLIEATDFCQGKDFSCYKAPTHPGDRRKDLSRFRVATFNVEWLFLEDATHTNDLTDEELASNCPGTGCPWANQTMAERHLSQIAKVIRTLDADFLLLIEVQDCTVLSRLIQHLPDMGYHYYLLKGTDTATGQNVGFLSRVDPTGDLWRTADRVDYPMADSACGYRGAVGSSGVSKHLFAHFHLATSHSTHVDLMVAGLHLIAFPVDPARCSQREAQATVIQEVMNSHAGEAIILGDLNDYDNTILDAAGDVPTSKVLQILKNDYLPEAADNTTAVVARRLFNVAEKQIHDRAKIYSAWYDINKSCADEGGKEHTMIDHILVSQGLRSRISRMWFDHSFIASCVGFYSDHWPVVVEFSF